MTARSAGAPTRTLSIVVPTHNRSALLDRLLQSLVELRVPDNWLPSLVVVGNACTDSTAAVVARYQRSAPFPVTWIEELTAGKSHALNTGIAASNSDWVAFFDDDERVFPDWLEVFSRSLQELQFDFCAGRYCPDLEVPMPDWVPEQFAHATLTFHPDSLPSQPLDLEHALLFGGNCAIRRSALLTVGSFDPRFARTTGVRALGCEDSDMQFRLLEAGFKGWYLKDLKISHWTPASRLSKRHFRNWVYWGNYSVTQYQLRNAARVPPTPTVFGLATWQIRAALSAAGKLCWSWLTFREENVRLAHELALRSFAGRVRAVWEERNLTR